METIIIEEIKQINPRSRSGRKKIIGKTTADGKPEDPEYFKKYYEQNIKQTINCDGCGCLITKYAMRKHKLTKYCIQMTFLNLRIMLNRKFNIIIFNK